MAPSSPRSNQDQDGESEDGWDDIEGDLEETTFRSLFDGHMSSTVEDWLAYDCDTHGFDFEQVRKSHGIVGDFLSSVQLVNYIRIQVRNGRTPEDLVLGNKSDWECDKYLKPALEDDPVLYSLDDLDGGSADPDSQTSTPESDAGEPRESNDRVKLLEIELAKANATAERLTASNAALFDRLLEEDSTRSREIVTGEKPDSRNTEGEKRPDNDRHYFESYSFNDIHEVMLKDTVRTDAYRDFIYENKQLFLGKTVLDVGCGTGILSMMCARAGAKKVFAVDNSNIIEKARVIVFDNKLQDTIHCIRGKIEDIQLPAEQVDVIISEWMGYALLYEAMLDSVLFARRKYLAPGGLMVPSHAGLLIGAITAQDLNMSYVEFWSDVYGFDMNAMREGAFDNVIIQDVEPSKLCCQQVPVKTFTLGSVHPQDLAFEQSPFQLQLTEDGESFDAFIIWFDILFSKDPASDNTSPRPSLRQRELGEISFTTGPSGPSTHWRSVILLIDHGRGNTGAAKRGSTIRGNLSYQRPQPNDRELDIVIEWSVTLPGHSEQGKEQAHRQLWKLR